MGIKRDTERRCDFFGCTLPHNHSGMHHVICIQKRRCREDNIFRISPCKNRNDKRVTTEDVKYELIRSRLVTLKKQIDDLLYII